MYDDKHMDVNQYVNVQYSFTERERERDVYIYIQQSTPAKRQAYVCSFASHAHVPQQR